MLHVSGYQSTYTNFLEPVHSDLENPKMVKIYCSLPFPPRNQSLCSQMVLSFSLGFRNLFPTSLHRLFSSKTARTHRLSTSLMKCILQHLTLEYQVKDYGKSSGRHLAAYQLREAASTHSNPPKPPGCYCYYFQSIHCFGKLIRCLSHARHVNIFFQIYPQISLYGIKISTADKASMQI